MHQFLKIKVWPKLRLAEHITPYKCIENILNATISEILYFMEKTYCRIISIVCLPHEAMPLTS